MKSVKEFVKDRASRTDLAERLHVIWYVLFVANFNKQADLKFRFCIEMNSTRTRQAAVDKIFKAISTYATDIPVILVATKSDQFFGSQFQEARAMYKSVINDGAQLMQACDKYAADQINKRIIMIESEMKEVEGGRFDACVAVQKGKNTTLGFSLFIPCPIDTYNGDLDDILSIERLNQITLDSFSHEKLRLIYVAAQVSNIDLKIDCAIIETMKVYRKVLGTTSALGLIPTAPTSNRTASAIAVCKAIVKCFGLPTINSDTIHQIVKCTLWDDLGHNLSIALAEGIATVGLGASVLSGGMPIFLLSGAINLPLVVPATTRLMLMLASDLILILTQAFKKTISTCVGQPLVKDVEQAAIGYRPIASKVHKKVVELVPKRNLVKSFRTNEVRLGLEKILHHFKEHLTEDAIVMEDLANISIRPKESQLRDIKEVKTKIEEMEVETEIEEMHNDILRGYHEYLDTAQSNGFYSDEAKKRVDFVAP